MLKDKQEIIQAIKLKRAKRKKMKLEIEKLTKEVVNMDGVCIK